MRFLQNLSILGCCAAKSTHGSSVPPDVRYWPKADIDVHMSDFEVSAQQSADEREAIHQVVSGYFDAFARDPAVAATFYGEPTLIVLQNEVRALATRSDVEAFLEKLLGSLKPLGYSNTKLTVPRTKMVNATTALYSTVAIRMKTDGTELQKAGFTYLLQKGSAGWKIHEVIATDIDKLIVAD
jgi:hypothetical protein